MGMVALNLYVPERYKGLNKFINSDIILTMWKEKKNIWEKIQIAFLELYDYWAVVLRGKLYLVVSVAIFLTCIYPFYFIIKKKIMKRK